LTSVIAVSDVDIVFDEGSQKQPSHNDLGWLNQSKKVTTVTSGPYSVKTYDDILRVKATMTITLPRASRGREIYVNKDYAGGTVTISPTSPDTVAGGASYALTTNYTTAHLKAVSGGWILL
jgi:hypothetical protein